MIAVVLCALAMVDASFTGFRAFAGRDGRIVKRDAKIAAIRIGASAGVAALVLMALGLGALMLFNLATYDELVDAGGRMLVVNAIFAAAITLGFAAYFSPALEVRSLGTVIVLGPGTFLRPFVILGGALYASVGASAVVAGAALCAATIMIGIEHVLTRYFARSITLPGKR